jgi:signal transduction histidine kinase
MEITGHSNQATSKPEQVPAWARDLLLGAVVTLVIALVISADQGGQQPADALAYLFAAAFGALMLLRRRFPVVVLIATMLLLFGYYTLQYPAIGLAVPVAAALYSAAEQRRVPAAVVVSLLLVGVSTYFRLRSGEAPGYLGYELASSVALLAASIALGDSSRARRDLRAEQAQIARLLGQEHAYRAEQRVQAERLRIARELHDVIGHSITVIALHADVAREALGRSDDEARRALRHIRATSSETMRELRATVKLLRSPGEEPPQLTIHGLAQLDALVERARAGGLRVELRRADGAGALPASVDAAAYRIIQEALTNVLRHAGASEVAIALAVDERALRLKVANDGGVVASPLRWGAGIAGMTERARALGGTLTAEPRPEGGFVVQASLPLQEGS